MLTASEAYSQRARTEEAIADSRKQMKAEAKYNQHRQAVLAALKDCPDGETKSALRTAARLNPANFAAAMDDLTEEGVAERCTIEKNGRKFDGYRCVTDDSQDVTVAADQSDQSPLVDSPKTAV